jgi:general L-amino acid transport system permease protein
VAGSPGSAPQGSPHRRLRPGGRDAAAEGASVLTDRTAQVDEEPQARIDEAPTATVETTVTGEIAVAVEPAARPPGQVPPRQWVKENLFRNTGNSILTVVFGAVLLYLAYRLLRFVFVTAEWEIVRRNLRLFMVGRDFPVEELWRVWLSVYILAAAIGLVMGVAARAAAEQARARGVPLARSTPWGLVRRYWPLLLVTAVILSFTRTVLPGLLLAVAVAILIGVRFIGRHTPWLAKAAWPLAFLAVIASVVVVSGFDGIPWDNWGGLHLTLFVTIAGITFATPFGIAMALSRRSSLPALRWVTVSYIEIFRGVPLVTLLFMGQFLVPLFFPNTIERPSVLLRALIAVTLFEAAYIAETIRGGLQAMPRGQYEASMALGLRPWTTTRKIILPQAIRNVIPAMVGQFISLFKDTALLSVLFFTELLAVVDIVVNQPAFQGQRLHTVAYAFVALIFWAVSYSMSRESRRLERRLGVGER